MEKKIEVYRNLDIYYDGAIYKTRNGECKASTIEALRECIDNLLKNKAKKKKRPAFKP